MRTTGKVRAGPRDDTHRVSSVRATMDDEGAEPLVEQQFVGWGGITGLEVVPCPAKSPHGIGERVALGDEPARDVANALGVERVGDSSQRQHGILLHVVAHAGVAASDHSQVAPQRPVSMRAVRDEERVVAKIRAELRECHRGREQLHVRRWHEELAGVVRVQCVATGVDDENPPVGVPERGCGNDRVERGAEPHRGNSRRRQTWSRGGSRRADCGRAAPPQRKNHDQHRSTLHRPSRSTCRWLEPDLPPRSRS